MLAEPCAICPGGIDPDAIAGYTCKDSAGALLGDSNIGLDFAALAGQHALGRSLGKHFNSVAGWVRLPVSQLLYDVWHFCHSQER